MHSPSCSLASRRWRGGGRPSRTRRGLRTGDLEIDLLARTAQRAGKPILLQPREFKLLEYLMRNVGNVVTRTMLLENVWDYHFDPQTNVIDVHISRLRSKIDKGFAEPCCTRCAAPDTPSVRASLSLIRTSTFRLAAIYVVIFAAIGRSGLAYVYWSIANLLEDQTDNAIGSEVKAIAEVYRQNGLPGVLEQVMLRTAEANQGVYIFTNPVGGASPAICRDCRSRRRASMAGSSSTMPIRRVGRWPGIAPRPTTPSSKAASA